MKEIPQEMKFVEPLLREVSETIKQNAMLEMKAARQKELKLFAESAWNPMVKNVKDLTDVVNSLSLKCAKLQAKLEEFTSLKAELAEFNSLKKDVINVTGLLRSLQMSLENYYGWGNLH